jgi:hypothetical protein
MSLSPQYDKELNAPPLAPDSASVRRQLKLILANPLFTNSKRYPVMLAYVVEQTLAGNAAELKERTIGVEAFGREPSYDVNLDPVVRTTAAEIRKRLIQYYYNPEHAGELIIELPVGSYVPFFREPAPSRTALVPASSSAQKSDSSPEEIGAQNHAVSAPGGFGVQHWVWTAATLLIGAIVGFSVGHIKLPKPPSNQERFWAPISATSSRITYCVGESRQAFERQQPRREDNPVGVLNLSDVITLARSIGPLVLGKSSFRVVSALDVGFAELREGPIVLIGAYNNPWTLRTTQDLPIVFDSDIQLHRIVDRKDPAKKSWTSQWRIPNVELATDYAVVARFHDTVTGQPVIVLAGILAEGTEAASEVVSNPDYLNSMLEKLPKDWDKQNLEAVIETRVIEGHPGPPTVVAVETW